MHNLPASLDENVNIVQAARRHKNMLLAPRPLFDALHVKPMICMHRARGTENLELCFNDDASARKGY
jgi:hypothetical protein